MKHSSIDATFLTNNGIIQYTMAWYSLRMDIMVSTQLWLKQHHIHMSCESNNIRSNHCAKPCTQLSEQLGLLCTRPVGAWLGSTLTVNG